MGLSKPRVSLLLLPPFLFLLFKTMRLILACLATAAIAAAPTAAVRVNLPTDQVAEIHVGQKLEVVVAGNPTTGYSWKVTSLPEGMAQVGEPAYVQDPADGPDGRRLLGVGGRFIFTLVGSKPVEGAVQLAYSRPWEKDTPPIQTLALRVKVIAPR